MPTAGTPQEDSIASIISPEIVEQIAKEALAGTYKKACEHLMGDFYDACQRYMYEHFANLEANIWRDVSAQVINGYTGGRWSKYDHKNLRITLYREHRDEIAKELNADLVAENEKLKKDLEYERSIRRY